MNTLTNARDLMTVDLPEIDQEGVNVTRFEVTLEQARFDAIRSGGRAVHPGTYTRLTVDGRLWMSDTPAEQRDHIEPFLQAQRRGGRVLINGLGLGMVVKAVLALDNVTHVDVVEVDPRIVAAIGPHYESERCNIHLADAYTVQWPTNTSWTVAWHDIWPDLTGDNLPGIATLKRRYGRRTDWQGAWAEGPIRAHRDRAQRNGWW